MLEIRTFRLVHGLLLSTFLLSISASRVRLEHTFAESGAGRIAQNESLSSPPSDPTKDTPKTEAEKALAEGLDLIHQGTAESSRAGIARLERALSAWRSIGSQRDEVRVLRHIGDAYQPLGDFSRSLNYYNQALAINRTLKDQNAEAQLLNALSFVHLTLGENSKALELCQKAARLSDATGNRREKARALNNLGEINYGNGQMQQSLAYYAQALPIWTELNDREGQALTYLNIGYTSSDLGQMQESLNSYSQALALWQALGNKRGQAMTLTGIGRLYSRMGESQTALNFFAEAIQLARVVGDPIEEARTLTGMAYVHDGLGEKTSAINYYEQARALFRKANYSPGEAATLADVGLVYHSLGDNQKALESHQQASALFKAVGDRRMEIFELKEIGRVLESLGDKTKALPNYLLAHAFYRGEKDLRGEADTLSLIGRVYEGRDERRKALDHYIQALPLAKKAEYRVGVAATLHNIARVKRDLGDLQEASKHAAQALNVVESLREKVDSQDLRTSYFASIREQYEFYIDLLMRLNQQQPAADLIATAFEASERARARSLLETLAAARIEVRQEAHHELWQQSDRLRREIAAKQENLLHGNPNETHNVAIEIQNLNSQLLAVEQQIGPIKNLQALKTQPLRLKEVQALITDDNTLLLEYALGNESSYLWAITHNEITAYQLPRRDEVEHTARKVYDLLIANQPLINETFAQQQDRIAKAEAELPTQIARLSDVILGPVAAKLGTKRLVIVADGALQYVPFQILTLPTGQSSSRTKLLEAHEIINEPSASAMALLSDTRTRKKGSREVAILADPVFSVDDPRVRTVSRSKTRGDRLAESPIPGINSAAIPRLPASRAEADAIMSLLSWRSGFKAIDFEANRTTALRPDIGDYRILHIATHALVNSEHPENSGVVLSLFDRNGNSQDGFLKLEDIYNLKLPVDLVVLSACNTGLGKDVRGEGLIGLTRGFMYAGASSVVASLWKVDDDATAELMKHFYRSMLKGGLAPAAALRHAQLKVSQTKRWQSPYYWSGFIIQGQYATPVAEPEPESRSKALIWWLATTVLVGLAALFFLKQRRKRSL
jgi:CHAT domain-containing protein/tetratricopeptide (TPR) repeat protein